MSNRLYDSQSARSVLKQGVDAHTEKVRGDLAYLGNPADPGNINDAGDLARASGIPNAVYIHTELENPRSVGIATLSAGFPAVCLTYQCPVRVRDERGRRVVVEPYGALAAEFFANTARAVQQIVSLNQLNVLLLRSNQSWTCTVSPALLELDGERVMIAARQADDDFETTAAAVTAGMAVAVLVEVDIATNDLVYTTGAEFDYDPDTQNPSHEEAFNDHYPKVITEGREHAGYIRLYPTQEFISDDDVFAAQRVIGGGSGSGEAIDSALYLAWRGLNV